jgi:hypothetical protein
MMPHLVGEYARAANRLRKNSMYVLRQVCPEPVEGPRDEPARQTELARTAAFDHIAAERLFAFDFEFEPFAAVDRPSLGS